jgi:hypothetical protein
METYWLKCIWTSSIEPPEEGDRRRLLAWGRTAALLAFNHLLPDAGMELFKQHADDAFTQFPLFGELPKELRIMIWRAAFPRNRTIQVELSPRFEILHSHTPPPVTLHINRESRSETLKFYVSLLNPCPRRPILFHPALDTVYFHRCKNDPLLFMQHTTYLTSRSLSGISKIQSLKIPKMYYGGQMQGWIKFGTPRRSLYGHGNFLEPDRGGLRFFHGLKELILVSDTKILGSVNYLGILNHPGTLLSLPPDDIIFTLDTEERIEEYQQAFRDFFDWEREKTPRCKIPEVIVRQGRNPRQDRWYLGRLSECLEDA